MWEAGQDAERSGRVKHAHARRLRHGCLASLQASVAGRSGQSPIRSEIASLPGPGQTTPHSGRGRTGNRENNRHYAPGIGTYVPFPEVGLAFQIGRWLDWPGRTPCRFLRQRWQRPSSLSSCALELVQRGFHCEGGRVAVDSFFNLAPLPSHNEGCAQYVLAAKAAAEFVVPNRWGCAASRRPADLKGDAVDCESGNPAWQRRAYGHSEERACRSCPDQEFGPCRLRFRPSRKQKAGASSRPPRRLRRKARRVRCGRLCSSGGGREVSGRAGRKA